jgi:chemotaxis protein MotB
MSAVTHGSTTRQPLSKPPVPPPPSSDTLEWSPAPARNKPGSRAWIVLAIASTLVAVGLGYVGFAQWQAAARASQNLESANAQAQKLGQERTGDAAKLEQQRVQLAGRAERIDHDGTELSELKAKLGAAEARLNELEAQSETLNEHLTEFRALTKQFQRMIDSGKLQISFRRGRMIVELPAAVLFASGSAELSADGQKALQEIAKILRKVPGKRFIVGGHTDDVPIAKTNTYSSNWALSAARAVRVTESLLGSGMRANHLVASGFGEFDPIASNASEQGRQKNRRIEIVLEPELGQLSNAIAELKKDAGTKPAAAKK